jgi:cytochrome P450
MKRMQDVPRALRIFERTLDGATFRDCAVEFGLRHQRVAQLVMWTAHMLLTPDYLQQDVVPEHDWRRVKARAEYADFWRRLLVRARKRHAPANLADL